MSYGPKQVFTCSIASAATTSTVIDLSKSFKNISVNVQTSATNAMMTVYGGTTSTGTFFPIHERVNTAPVQYQALTVATSTSGGWAVLDAPPFQYIQFVASAAVNDGTTITVIGQD